MNDLFFDEEVVIKKLQDLGYRIIKTQYLQTTSVSTIKQLIHYFYSRRYYYNRDRKFPYSIDYSIDSRSVSSFIKSRQKLGLGRKAAIEEATQLVDALFKFEKYLYLKNPIIRPAILAVRPLMDRVCSFLNNEVDEVGEADTEIYINEINEIYNKKFTKRDFQQAFIHRQNILKKMNSKLSKGVRKDKDI